MSSITAIEIQKRRGNRRSIYVDGQFVAGVDERVVLDLGLKIGQEVDEDRLTEVLREEETGKAREYALGLLDYRARTRKELERKMLQKGYAEEVVASILDRFENVDLINDERFASDWVESRLTYRPTGKSRMLWDLRRKGVAPEVVDEALEQVDDEKEFEMALDLAQRKLGDNRPRDPETKRKLVGFLQRRGFRWDVVSRVLDRLAPED